MHQNLLNNYLNNFFPKKSFFYKLIFTLKKKNLYLIVIMKGELKEFLKKKAKIISRTDEINILIEYYRNMEKEMIYYGSNSNDNAELWYNCLIDLNNKNTL